MPSVRVCGVADVPQRTGPRRHEPKSAQRLRRQRARSEQSIHHEGAAPRRLRLLRAPLPDPERAVLDGPRLLVQRAPASLRAVSVDMLNPFRTQKRHGF